MARKKKDVLKEKIQASRSEPVQPPPPMEENSSAASDRQPKVKPNHFPIVGIGASAGGLAAFEAFFSGMPVDSDPGMAFVLVQHLAPDHKSILTDLVRRYTRMQVFEVEDGMVVEPNCAYIIPPNRDMAFLNGTLQLLEPVAPRGPAPADRLLLPLPGPGPARAGHLHRALGHGQRRHPGRAGDQGRGRHGHGPGPGIHRVRRHAAQRHRHRPGGLRAAAGRDAGPAHRLRRRMPSADPRPAAAPGAQGRERAEEDLRPAARPDRPRLFPVQAEHHPPPDRAAHGGPPDRRAWTSTCATCSRRPAEVEALFRDLLIGVTSFFRDPEAFKALERAGHSEAVCRQAARARSIRVWSPGCSTGEEAYSLAILLAGAPGAR